LIEIQKRWRNLVYRHQESEKVVELPVLTTEKTQQVIINEVASKVTIKTGEIDINTLADLDISPYYQHTAKLQLNRDYAQKLPDDLISAKIFSGKEPLIYMLLFYNNDYRGIFYNPKSKQLIEPDVVKLLNKIACEKDTPTAHVDYDFIEDLADTCLNLWCEQNQAFPDDVQRICSLYLKPDKEEDDIKLLLDSINNQ
jgi:hypothetical protein